MRKMKDSGIEWIGEIPESWSVHPAKYAFTEIREKNTDGKIQLALQFKNGSIIRKNNFEADSDDYVADTILNYTIVEPNTIMINGLNLNYDLKSLRVAIVREKGIITSAYLALKPDEAKISPEFANYLFKGYESKMAFHNMGAGIRLTLGFKEFKNQPVLFPETYEEQLAISAYLDRQCALIDSVTEKTKASIEEYKKLRQAVITQAVTKGVRGDRPMKDSGIEWIGEIPEEWETTKVRYIGSLQNGISKGGEFFGEGYPFVSYGDIYRNFSIPQNVAGLVRTTEEEREQYSVIAGDIFFTRTSETIEEVGFSAVCETTIENATFAGFVIRLRPYKADSIILTGFAKYYFRGEHIRKYLVKQMNLVTRASLGQGLLNAMSVLVPSHDEQSEIVAYLDKKCAEIDALIAKKETFLTELEAYKKSLIYEYVTGKKEVPQA